MKITAPLTELSGTIKLRHGSPTHVTDKTVLLPYRFSQGAVPSYLTEVLQHFFRYLIHFRSFGNFQIRCKNREVSA
jgi:hypothetical protein